MAHDDELLSGSGVSYSPRRRCPSDWGGEALTGLLPSKRADTTRQLELSRSPGEAMRCHRGISVAVEPFRRVVALTLAVLLAFPSPGLVQIVTDGTLGPGSALPGPNYVIGSELGQVRGANLFHSFREFNVGTGERASFTGPPAIENIVSRVTGGNQSLINGSLHSAITGANLYLLNPRGVIFGPNAALDITGSFHVSTGDFLRFADGTRFPAVPSPTTTLSMAPPTAFGFLGNNASKIVISGSQLVVSPTRTLSIVGGDLAIDGGAFLGAESGRINLVSGRSSGEVVINNGNGTSALTQTLTRFGEITVSGQSTVDVSGDQAGDIAVAGGSIAIMGERAMQAISSVDGGSIVINATEAITVSGPGTVTRPVLPTIFSATIGPGTAGRISLSAPLVKVLDKGIVASGSFGSGYAGGIAVEAGRLELERGGGIGNAVVGAGAADPITIRALELSLDGGVIESTSESLSVTAAAAQIEVQAQRLSLKGGAQISSSTRGSAPGGAVTVVAGESVSLAGNQSSILSITNGSGAAGRVNVVTPALTLDDRAVISTSTFPHPVTNRPSTGRAGDVVVKAATIKLTGGAQIQSSSTGPEQAGSVVVTATSSLDISGRGTTGKPAAVLAGTTGSGGGGQLQITAGRLTVRNGGEISVASNDGSGSAGNATITAGEIVVNRGTISSDTTGDGPGGSIELRAPQISLTSGAAVSATSRGRGRAGGIVIVALDTLTARSGTISVSATSADGGNISLQAANLVYLIDSQVIAAVQGGAGAGGNIRIAGNSPARFVILDNSQIRADAFGGPGGNIEVLARTYLADRSVLSASSTLSFPGTVSVSAQTTDVEKSISRLPETLLHGATLLRASCAVRFSEGAPSSLVVEARDLVPLEPEGPSLSPLIPLLAQALASRGAENPDPMAGAARPPRMVVLRCAN
jgi:filamentous hemagglutinin family protein